MSNNGDFAAGQRLLETKQTGTTREYANQYRKLASRVSWNVTALKDNFYRCLSDEVKDITCMQDPPNGLEEYIQKSQNIETLSMEGGETEGLRAGGALDCDGMGALRTSATLNFCLRE